jgi:hypothetical protein
MILIGFIISLISCFNNDLPEPTQEGEDTFGMKVDGRNWERSYSLLSDPNRAFLSSSGRLTIVGLNTTKDEKVEIRTNEVLSIGEYNMAYNLSQSCGDSTRFESQKQCELSYKLFDSLRSKVIITRLDTIERIIAGTFEMDLKNNEGTLKEITEGRFDFKL